MQYQPKTEKEIAEENLRPAGIYNFEVIAAEDKVSKSGNDMIVLKLRIFETDGTYFFIDDYLLEKIAYKLRHAAVACGLEEKYKSGVLVAADFSNKTSQVKIRIDQDKTGKYADKNVVGDYVVQKGEHQAPSPEIDDSIPF